MVAQNLLTTQIPALPDVADNVITVGTTVRFAVNGTVTGVRWYAPTNAIAGLPTGALWDISGTLLASATYSAITLGTWNTVLFSSPVAVTAGQLYVVGTGPVSRYTATGNFFTADLVNGDITGPQDAAPSEPLNGRFQVSGVLAFPVTTFGHNLYFADVLFEAGPQTVNPNSVTLAVSEGNPTLTDTSSTVVPASVTLHVSEGPPTLSGPTVSGDTMFLPVAQNLLACLCFELNSRPNPPQICCLRGGEAVIQDAGILLDECCKGQAYVRIVGVSPTGHGGEAPFPSPSTDFPVTGCGVPAWNLVLEVGVFRCAPTGSANLPATCAAWNTAVALQQQDMVAVKAAICCLIATLDPQSVAIGTWEPQGPDGGCLGSTWQITVEVDNCEGC